MRESKLFVIFEIKFQNLIYSLKRFISWNMKTMFTIILLNPISYLIQLQAKPKVQINWMISPNKKELFKKDYSNPLSIVYRNVSDKLIFFLLFETSSS